MPIDVEARLADGLAPLLSHLVEVRGSDLFLKAGCVPRVRIDGRLQAIPFAAPDPAAIDQLVRMLLPGSREDELAVSGATDFAVGVSGVGRFRVHVYRQRGTLGVVIRQVLPGIPTWERLGLPPIVDKLAAEGSGLVLVTGPAGSGKTTTLNAIVDHINEHRAVHIVTIEDPIEYLHTDKQSMVSQREVGSDTPSMAEGLHRALRQAPDVLVVGHLDDLDTLQAALGAVASGQLVLATVATTSARETITRLIERFAPHLQGQARHQLASAVRGVLSQRLLERADGRGRTAAVEVLMATPKVEDCIRQDGGEAGLAQLIADGRYHGMQGFDQALFALCREGLVSLRDALAAAIDPDELRMELQQAGLTSA